MKQEQVSAPHEPSCAVWRALDASCDCKKCGQQLLWPDQGHYHLHLCALPDGHQGLHRSAANYEWMAT